MPVDDELQLLAAELLRTRSRYVERGTRHLVERIDALLGEVNDRVRQLEPAGPSAA